METRLRILCLVAGACFTTATPNRIVADPHSPDRASAAHQTVSVPAFDETFRDETLRIDTAHTGDAGEELITLDRVYRYGIWAGSRKHLIDPLPNGNYWVKVYDAGTDALIFSKGFDSYFGEYQTTSDAAAGIKRAYHETALIPCPRAKVRFAIERRQHDRAMREIFSTEIDPDAWTVRRDGLADGVIVVDEARGGDPHACVDIAIVGEGYTAEQEEKFRADLARYAALLLGHEPYASLRGRFNIRGVLQPSAESGCDEPSRGVFKRTAIGATFDALGSERYMLTEDNRALRDIAANVPYDALYIMVNHERYGGGGIYNLYCTFTTDNQFSPYIFLHEFGHAFAGLADEYYTSSVAYNEFYPRGVEPVEPNITALLDPAALKWRDLVTSGTPVPTPWEKAGFDEMDLAYQKARNELNETIARRMREGAPAEEIDRLKPESEERAAAHTKRVDDYFARSAFVSQVGAFEGAGYAAQGLYRSQLDCLMFSKGTKPFCAACRRAVERVIERYGE